jgi:hypothetical protein
MKDARAVPMSWRTVFGASDRFLRFAVFKAKSQVNEGAKAAADDPRFSVRISEGLPRMSRECGGAGVTR